ncbi:MAG TPA: hypothetical protein VFU65_14815 [Actinocrinis sp.]|nr:hypothetical protein [Actinocrinis sp.]
MMTAAGGGLAVGLGQPAGAWAGYGTSSIAAILGFGTLWQQRGLLERRAKEMARRRRADLDELAVAEQRHRSELERVKAELEHEQQYSVLIQEQLTRAREQLERERAARRTAERDLDALTGSDSWASSTSSLVLTVEEPGSGRPGAASSQGVDGDEPAADGPRTASRPTTSAPAAKNSSAQNGNAAARRRGWQVVDGNGDDRNGTDGSDVPAAETDRLYRPFIDHLAAAQVPVSEAALAMAPVIGAGDLDGVLDLTAYDETVEFSVREIKGMA